MSKSIVIKGADFSQNGFRAPIPLSFETVFGSLNHDTFLANQDSEQHPDWIGVEEANFIREYGAYVSAELRVGKIDITGFLKIKAKFKFYSSTGIGLYLFADSSKTCLATPEVTNSAGTHSVNSEITIPAQAKYFYCTFDPDYEYSFIGI